MILKTNYQFQILRNIFYECFKMKKALVIMIICGMFSSCKQERTAEINSKFAVNAVIQKFEVDYNIIPDSISKKFKKFNLNNDVVCLQNMGFGLRSAQSRNRDYHSNAFLGENDTLNIWINNFNGNFGNGILLKVFDDKFYIKSVNPKVIKGIKFEDYELKNQKLILNKTNFKKGDSLFGYLFFNCFADSTKNKKMEGFFQTKISLE